MSHLVEMVSHPGKIVSHLVSHLAKMVSIRVPSGQNGVPFNVPSRQNGVPYGVRWCLPHARSIPPIVKSFCAFAYPGIHFIGGRSVWRSGGLACCSARAQGQQEKKVQKDEELSFHRRPPITEPSSLRLHRSVPTGRRVQPSPRWPHAASTHFPKVCRQ